MTARVQPSQSLFIRARFQRHVEAAFAQATASGRSQSLFIRARFQRLSIHHGSSLYFYDSVSIPFHQGKVSEKDVSIIMVFISVRCYVSIPFHQGKVSELENSDPKRMVIKRVSLNPFSSGQGFRGMERLLLHSLAKSFVSIPFHQGKVSEEVKMKCGCQPMKVWGLNPFSSGQGFRGGKNEMWLPTHESMGSQSLFIRARFQR